MEEARKFAKNLVDEFEVSNDSARFSLLFQGYESTLEVSFQDNDNAEELKQAIDRMGQLKYVGNVDEALQSAADRMFSKENVGDRSSLPQMLVFLTSDKTQSDTKGLDEALEGLTGKGVKTCVVVVGNGLQDEVRKIAPKTEDVFRVDGLDKLSKTIDPLVDRLVNNGKGTNFFISYTVHQVYYRETYFSCSPLQDKTSQARLSLLFS